MKERWGSYPKSEKPALKRYDITRVPYKLDRLPEGMHWSLTMKTQAIVDRIPDFTEAEIAILQQTKQKDVRNVIESVLYNAKDEGILNLEKDKMLGVILSASGFIHAARLTKSAYLQYDPAEGEISYRRALNTLRKVLFALSPRDRTLFDVYSETQDFLERESEILL